MKTKAKSLYIHIPFCNNLCDYCDFPKLQYFRFYAEKYINTLIEEIESFKITHDLNTIYIGGGTPTSLEDDLLEKLLSYLLRYVHSGIEYTIEANPENLTKEKISLLKKYKINRVSIGVESTNDDILKTINRRHTFKDVQDAVHNLRNADFNNISLDLILGLPNVTMNMLKKDIYNILSLKPDHISCYSLTVHPNTVFYFKNIPEPTEDFSREAYDLIHEELKMAGYDHYEVSNFAKDNKRSRHNLTYWRNEGYFGAGLGAAGYLDNLRYKNARNIDAYNNKLGFMCEKEFLNLKDKRDYDIILRLRTTEGINLNGFKNSYNEDLLTEYSETINELIKQNLLCLDEVNNRLFATYEGLMVLDSIILKFI